MEQIRFEKGYRRDDTLRVSFCELAKHTFGLEFEGWYEKGFWNDRYIPFSFIAEGKVVANVSASKIDLVIDGTAHPSLQIGTVMTHPNYRNQGLSRKLMEKVMSEYEGQCSFMYLFANESVKGFYPKFGFRKVEEQQFYLAAFSSGSTGVNGNLRKLDTADTADLQLITEYIEERVPVSNRFATANAAGITLYHMLTGFKDCIYHSEKLDALLLYKQEKQQLNIFDVISKAPVETHAVATEVADENTETILFHYTPDNNGIGLEKKPFKRNGALFVKENSRLLYPSQVRFPVASEA